MKYGWKPDLPDFRDRKGLADTPHLAHVAVGHFVPPPEFDLRVSNMPPVYDQGALGSCTGNAIASAVQYERKRQGLPDFIPSRLMIYYNERDAEGTVDSDAGASIRDGIKLVGTLGVCPETEWHYDITQFKTKPPDSCYADAAKFKSLDYWAVPRSLMQMRGCLAAGFPFVFGFSVYSSFESAAVAQSGIVPMPAAGESQLGGHAVKAVGYNDASRVFIVKNSWGEGWGDKGYFYLPYEYLMDEGLSSDFWTIKVESA